MHSNFSRHGCHTPVKCKSARARAVLHTQTQATCSATRSILVPGSRADIHVLYALKTPINLNNSIGAGSAMNNSDGTGSAVNHSEGGGDSDHSAMVMLESESESESESELNSESASRKPYAPR